LRAVARLLRLAGRFGDQSITGHTLPIPTLAKREICCNSACRSGPNRAEY